VEFKCNKTFGRPASNIQVVLSQLFVKDPFENASRNSSNSRQEDLASIFRGDLKMVTPDLLNKRYTT